VHLRDEPAHLRGIQLREARFTQQAEKRRQVVPVDLEAAPRQAPLVLERAEVLADRGLVRVRGRVPRAVRRARPR
jgi:hypothetical protein